jgi:hypothetical protein
VTAARTIISDAMREHGIIGAGEEPSPEESDFCLRRLNQAMQRMSNQRLAFPALTAIDITLNGAQEYTVGPTGGTSAARPIKVESMSAIDAAGVEWPVEQITSADWADIAVKNVSGGPPDRVWYEATETDGTFHVYPKATGYTLRAACQVLLDSFASIGSILTFPEGYETWLTLQLADDIATVYGKQTTPDTRRRLAAAAALVKASNTKPTYLDVSLGDCQPYSIQRGS